jgi:hypothetical protein
LEAIEMSDAKPYKLHVKIGTSEFNAEGTEAAVQAQYASFLEAIRTQPAGAQVKPPGKEEEEVPPPPEINPDLLARAYVNDGKGAISLRVLPKTEDVEGDAILLLIYGFRVLANMESVLAGPLTDAARTSGLNLARVDRSVGTNNQYIQKGGSKRGSRYALNNPGIQRAQSLLKGLFD